MSAVKPEIYISWIPRGNIEVKPQIYATIIPSSKVFTSAKADTNRRIGNSEDKVADTLRIPGTREKVTGDSLRILTNSEPSSADTLRQIKISTKKISDTFRKVVQGKNRFDTLREVQRSEKIIADTSRKLNLATVKADTRRTVKSSTEFKSDTNRRIGNTEKISVDTFREVGNKNIAKADTFRKIECKAVTVVKVDTLRIPGYFETAWLDTYRKVTNPPLKVIADTCRRYGSYNLVQADTSRQLTTKATADTFRKIFKPAKIFSDTIIRIPHILKYTINSPLISTFKDLGVNLFSVTLAEKTLSDTFQVSLAKPFEINEAVRGQFLDYPFNFLVEETTQQDLFQTIKGMYNQDELLYTRLATNGIFEEGITEVMASEFITGIANYLGLHAIVQIDDFEPSHVSVDLNTTYASVLSNLFGWTSKLPQRQINVFIRGENLYCIQRGKETKTFDITNLPHSRPIISKKLLRTMWSCPSNTADSADTSDDEASTPFSGTISFGHLGTNVSLTYENGLLISETQSISNTQIGKQATFESNSVTTYTYLNYENAYYINAKTVKSYSWERNAEDGTETKTESNSHIQYIYAQYWGEYYLSNEYETETTKKSELTETNTQGGFSYLGVFRAWEVTEEKTNHKETLHVPLGNGWYGQAVYVNGVAQGSNVSQGAPTHKITQFTVEEMKKYQHSVVVKYNAEPADELEQKAIAIKEQLSSLIDDSWPVKEDALKNALTLELEWLNRKIQEEISVDILDTIIDGVPNVLHVIDFTENIMLNGVIYFLVQNQIHFTPRKLVQKLRLIRWY